MTKDAAERAWRRGVAVLRADTTIGPLIRRYGPIVPPGVRQPFLMLLGSIVSQQISGKAAEAILARVRRHFQPLTPRAVAASDLATLRSLGLSPQKASYALDLADKFLDGTIRPRAFPRLSDEAIIDELVRVKGVGRWTAEMFLIFSLRRPDVWPVDDYGVQKAVKAQLRMRAHPTKERMRRAGARWRPYRSVAAVYLWRSLENR